MSRSCACEIKTRSASASFIKALNLIFFSSGFSNGREKLPPNISGQFENGTPRGEGAPIGSLLFIFLHCWRSLENKEPLPFLAGS